jgi:hypothetical protein
MSFVENFTKDINKNVLNGITLARKSVNNVIEDVGSRSEKSVNNVANIIGNNIDNTRKNVVSVVRSVENDINSGINKVVTTPGTNIEKTITNTAKSSVKKYDGALKEFYKTLFKYLIKPFDKHAVMTYRDYNVFKIIGMSILLITSYVSTTIYDNTIGLLITFIEKLTGVRLDGRVQKRTKKDTKISVIWKIITTILNVFAQLLDLILLAFTNQTSVFSNIVKDLLKKN